MTNELWDVPHGQPPNQELVEHGDSTEFNLLFPINDKENNIKDIVLRIIVDENEFRVFGWVRFINHLSDDDLAQCIGSDKFLDAVKHHLSQIIGGNMGDANFFGDAWEYGVEIGAYGGTENLEKSITQQLAPLHYILLHGDNEVYQAIKKLAG
jgi:hypothetical protein